MYLRRAFSAFFEQQVFSTLKETTVCTNSDCCLAVDMMILSAFGSRLSVGVEKTKLPYLFLADIYCIAT